MKFKRNAFFYHFFEAIKWVIFFLLVSTFIFIPIILAGIFNLAFMLLEFITIPIGIAFVYAFIETERYL